jgi:DNA-binding response OmpR family regulator
MTLPQARILLIEGQRSRTESVRPSLEPYWAVTVVHSGQAALAALTPTPDLILFDAGTMRSNGWRNCQRLRQAVPDTPFIYIGQTTDILPDLEVSVSLCRPFAPRKLQNRIRALLPADATEEQIVRLGHLTLYVGKRSLACGGEEHTLTPKLVQLLAQFLRHPNEILSREFLMEKVWETSYLGDTRTLDVHIRWIRALVEPNPQKPTLLRTVRRQGYCWHWATPEQGEGWLGGRGMKDEG